MQSEARLPLRHSIHAAQACRYVEREHTACVVPFSNVDVQDQAVVLA